MVQFLKDRGPVIDLDGSILNTLLRAIEFIALLVFQLAPKIKYW